MADLNILREELHIVVDTMDKLQIKDKFFLFGGNILSITKNNGNFLSNITDIDFGIMYENIQHLYMLVNELKRNGFKIAYSYYNNNNQLAQLSLTYKNYYPYFIDISVVYNYPEEMKHKWTCYINIDTPIEVVKSLPYSCLSSLKLETLEGRQVWIPKYPEMFIQYLYGGYRENRKKYCYYDKNDSPAVDELREWKKIVKTNGDL